MRAPAASKVRRIVFLFLPNDFPHRIAGKRNDLFDLRITESLSRFCRDRNKFLGQIDFDGRYLRLLSESLFDTSGAKSADHSIDGSRNRFRESRT
jgi:hypothetical protein